MTEHQKARLSRRLKNWSKSKTIKLNGLLLTLLPAVDYLRDNLELVREMTSGKWVSITIGVILAVNIALRFITDRDLADK